MHETLPHALSPQILHIIFGHSNIPIIVTESSDDHPTVFVNHAFELLTGYESHEILGKNCRFLQSSDRDQNGIPAIRHALIERTHCDRILRNYRKDGTLFFNHLHVFPLIDESGRTSHFAGIQFDVTTAVTTRSSLDEILCALERSTEICLEVSSEGNIIYANAAVKKTFGWEASELIGTSIYRLIPEIHQQQVRATLSTQLSSDTPASVNGEYIRRDGNNAFVEWTLSTGSSKESIVAIGRDVTEKREAEQAAALAKEHVNRLVDRLTTTLESITDAFYTVDREWKFTYLNKEAERVLRCSRQQTIGMMIWDAFPEAVNTRIELEYQLAVKEQRKVTFEEYYAPLATWFEISAYPSDEGLAVYFRDISERKRSEAEIQNLAFYDPLTGLPNRRLLMDRLNHALAGRSRKESDGALFLIDLDNFKSLNDRLGHASGDMILQLVSSRLLSCVRACDTVARLGGDEFVVLIDKLSDNQLEAVSLAKLIGDKLVTCLQKPYSYNNQQYHLSASIGISLFTEHSDSASEAFRRADIAMYQAKASGRNSAQFFDSKMQAMIDERASVEADIRTGIELDQFELYYQPQLDQEERITGVEALMRWLHPERGMISPAEFISLAEETGLMVPLGDWALKKACQQVALWKTSAQTCSISIAVNISAVQIRQQDFVAKVIQAIRDADISPGLVKLELTESLLVDDIETTIAKMNELKSIGVKFSLDDFGTGYSSLSYLKRLPFESVKIDQSFVRDVLDDPNDAAIASAIVSMARSLGLGVIAEGVETIAHKEKLLTLGCNHFQGYAFCKPLPISQLEDYLVKKRR